MTSWQKRIRIGLAIFGVTFAAIVYRSIGERAVVNPPPAVDRLDPKAILETTESGGQQVRGSEREFQIKFERMLTYEDQSARHFSIEITVPRPGGQVVVITAKEGLAGPNQVELKLVGEVTLSASDGFRLTTELATFNQDQGVAGVPGAVTFEKGHLSGSGLGATYDARNDVLRIAEQARITVTDQSGRTTLDGRAGTATLDRVNDTLFLDSLVHILRDTQVIDAHRATARLSSNDDVVTYLELRENARVQGGGGSIESMSASAIDLDYTDDGTILERAILNGGASVALPADEHAAGRGVSGESLDLQLASDGALIQLTGQERVRLDLPGGGDTPVRSIRARSLDATSESGAGLDLARFRDDVVFREEGSRGGQLREARARALDVTLDGDAVSSAFFTGGVRFEERDLRADAAEARYQPEPGLLNLAGVEKGAVPRVSDEQISVEARSIDVTLAGHGMAAQGDVRTSLGGRRPAATGGGRGTEGGRLPGLLQEGVPASINAETLDYSGANGRAVYSGSATLVQGETAIRGDRITLDQQKGDLLVSGSARSSLTLDSSRTDGRADEIRYDDAARMVTYSASRVAPTTGQRSATSTGRAGAGPAIGGGLARLIGPAGDLHAERIEVILTREKNQLDRLEAYTNVTMTMETRTAVGTRLTYHAREERYVLSGGGATPVTIRESRDSCRETTGRTLTFFKSTDRVIVDGDETLRTETRPCPSQPSR